MVLSLPGDHFDDYLAMLKSKERNSILRNLRRFEQSRLTIRRMKGDALRLLAHQMIQGYHHLYVRAGVKWLRHTAAYFESLSSFEDDIFVDVAFVAISAWSVLLFHITTENAFMVVALVLCLVTIKKMLFIFV